MLNQNILLPFIFTIADNNIVLVAAYAKQIIQYAGKIKTDSIAAISTGTDGYLHFADSHKEQLLISEMYIPVL